MTTNDSSDSHDQPEPYPAHSEERNHDAAVKTMGLQPQSVFKIGNDIFEYRYIDLGEAVVHRLSESNSTHSEKIPLTELWESHQRGNLKFGEWRCQFVAEDEVDAND
jgi:hypothetical protein